MISLSRRGLIGSLLAAPVIIPAARLMRVRSPRLWTEAEAMEAVRRENLNWLAPPGAVNHVTVDWREVTKAVAYCLYVDRGGGDFGKTNQVVTSVGGHPLYVTSVPGGPDYRIVREG